MLWYVLQTRTGEEDKLVNLIHKLVSPNLYEECFVVGQEQLWRRQQKNFVHVKRAFPGYVFITAREPEALFFCLKKLPAMAKLLADEELFFLSLEIEEAAFLRKIMDSEYVIRLSHVVTDKNGKIVPISGPLKLCGNRIVKCRLGKRYVLVRVGIHGEEKEALLGIVLEGDL